MKHFPDICALVILCDLKASNAAAGTPLLPEGATKHTSGSDFVTARLGMWVPVMLISNKATHRQ